ncbi:hypothetical protein [Pinibacter aurantiacus]|uniref:Uncharacterized protein n=1 Tax=Pinibacter aurantiacus TaxID=2851599 RepID=A0A9E2SC75_9BACT|nr:hypothetical protein [Pinibacter aurantiacus]MBV4358439.1 hypothetical protein [Pinibacter aurantiacus]
MSKCISRKGAKVQRSKGCKIYEWGVLQMPLRLGSFAALREIFHIPYSVHRTL